MKHLLALFVLLGAFSLQAQSAPKKLLVVTVTTGFRHSSIETAEKVLAELGRNPEFAVFLKEELLKDLEYGGTPKSRALINLNVAYQELKGEPVTTNFGPPRAGGPPPPPASGPSPTPTLPPPR